MINIDFDGKNLLVKAALTAVNIQILRSIPQDSAYSRVNDHFMCRPTQRNITYLRIAFGDQAVWSERAEDVSVEIAGPRKTNVVEAITFDSDFSINESELDYEFGTTPRPYQAKAFMIARGRRAFAYFMHPRTGKTKVVIDECCWSYKKGKIRRVLVICPKNVMSEWIEQVPLHSPKDVQHDVLGYYGKARQLLRVDLYNAARRNNPEALQWVVINHDTIARPNILDHLIAYVSDPNMPCAIVIDESTSIKSISTKRTKAAIKLGKSSPMRRIMSGTPSPNGPVDLYSQFMFLNKNIIGCNRLSEFLDEYTQPIPNVAFKRAPKNEQKLAGLIEPHSFRVRYKDVAKFLPKEDRVVIRVEMTDNQARMYDDLLEHLVAECEGREITVQHKLYMGMRLLQVTGGWCKFDDIDKKKPPDPIPGGNPKLDAMLEKISEYEPGEKIVIWAHFKHEIVEIHRRLVEIYGPDSAAMFYSGVNHEYKERVKVNFQDPEHPLRFFVGNPESGGSGIKLWRSNVAFYFSNSYDYFHREQSEMRIQLDLEHKTHVTYYDLIVPGTFDTRVISALKRKCDVASILMGDNLRDMLRGTP